MRQLIQFALLLLLGIWIFRRFGSSSKPSKQMVERSASRKSFEVLGVSENATQAEIHAAYQQLMQQYHPDLVAHMAKEIRDLAERRSKEINAAYAELKAL